MELLKLISFLNKACEKTAETAEPAFALEMGLSH